MQLLLALALVLPQDAHANRLTTLEMDAGWRLLFDGQSADGWRRFGNDALPEQGWEVRDGCLHLAPGDGGGDLVARGTYENFELELEWKVAAGSNSGVKYRVPDPGVPGAMLGPEYQVLDDASDTAPKHATGALYDVVAPGEKALRPAGEWNATRIVARGARIEHWLNGRRLLVADLASDAWKGAIAASKFAKVEGFALGRGHVGLQDHGGEVWYRSIKLRDWDDLPGEEVVLFDGKTLSGWITRGDAKFSVDDGCIVGESGGGGQSFLATERTFGDFILEVEVRNELSGNSGIQVRSHEHGGLLRGYQIEIDPSARAWSGGLYDEARRGWLDDLSDDEQARAAFRPGEWNTFRIECVRPSIKAWVNGVPTADYLDAMDLDGVIGLQVHSGTNTRVRWRHFRMRKLHPWSWEEKVLRRLMDEFRLRSLVTAGDGFFAKGEGQAWIDSEESWRNFSLRGKVHVRGTGAPVFAFVRVPWEAADGEDRGYVRLATDARSDIAPAEWHPFEIHAYGPRFQVNLDGRVLRDDDRFQYSLGRVRIGVEGEGHVFLAVDEVELLR